MGSYKSGSKSLYVGAKKCGLQLFIAPLETAHEPPSGSGAYFSPAL